MAPSYLELERAIASVPGVVEASVSVAPDTGRGRLRIRLLPGEDPEAVSWAVAATLRERFSIVLDPDEIRARPPVEEEATATGAEPVRVVTDDAVEVEPATEAHAPATSSRERLSEAAQAALEGLHGRPGRTRTRGGGQTSTPRHAEALFGPTGPLEDVPAEPEAEGPTDEAEGPTDEVVDEVIPAARPETETDEPREPWVRRRPEIRDLVVHHAPEAVEVSATLRLGERDVREAARGVPTSDGVLRAVAEATLRAVRALCDRGVLAGVDEVSVRLAGDPPVAEVVVSVLSDGGEERLLGGALVRGDVERAVMRATLDAVNRRIEPLLPRVDAG